MAWLSSLTHAVGVAFRIRLRSFPIGADLKKQILLKAGVTGITVETSTIKQYTIKLVKTNNYENYIENIVYVYTGTGIFSVLVYISLMS